MGSWAPQLLLGFASKQVRKGELRAVLLEFGNARVCWIPSCLRSTSRRKHAFKSWSSGAEGVGLLNISNNRATLLLASYLLKIDFILYVQLVHFLLARTTLTHLEYLKNWFDSYWNCQAYSSGFEYSSLSPWQFLSVQKWTFCTFLQCISWIVLMKCRYKVSCTSEYTFLCWGTGYYLKAKYSFFTQWKASFILSMLQSVVWRKGNLRDDLSTEIW